jgi:ketosteroid isomerase-like protein
VSEANVEVVGEFAAAVLSEDWKRAEELLDPEAEGHGTVGGLDEGQVTRGLTEMVAALTEDLEAWEERRLEPQSFHHVDDRVVVLLREYRRGRGSGIELEDDTAIVFTLRDGRILKMEGYMDQGEALKAAGLPPS